MLAEVMLDTCEWLDNLYNYIIRKPKATPSLLAYNVDWFTHCNWRDQLIAFKQIDIYRSNKH